MHWSLILVLAVGAAQQPGEPHSFPPDQLATYEALFRRLENGDREVTTEAERFLSANRENPRAHYLAGVARLRAGDKTTGRLELEEALRLGIGPVNRRASLLLVLAQSWLDDDRPRARAYLTEALRLRPDDANLLRLSAGMDLQDRNFREARPKLERLAQQLPENGEVHAELAAVRWNDGDHPGALESVRRAASLGVTEPFFGHIEREVRRERWRRSAIIGLLAALGGITLWLGLLAIATSLLSRTGLGALAEVKTSLESGVRTARELRVERAYTAVVWSAVALLVLSLPILLVGTVGFAAGLVWLMVQGGFVFPWLILLAVLGAGGAIWGILRALFLRLGPRGKHVLTRADQPGLYAVLDEVAAVASSEPVRDVILEPGAAVGVHERGSTFTVLIGRGQRVLSLGYGALRQLTVGELRAVLAHEYGHFSHGETRLTPVILRAEVVSVLMLQGMGKAGWLARLNPTFWFLRAYVDVFFRLNRAQGRRRELLADRVSAMAYGGETFGRALSRVGHAQQDLPRALGVALRLKAMGLTTDGIYGLLELKSRDLPAPLRRLLDSDETPGDYDSHPPTAERIERVQGIQGAMADDPRPAVEILAEPGRLAQELSSEVLEQFRLVGPPMPRPVQPVEDVARALSHLLDAQELAAREPRSALPFVESSVAEGSEALGAEHPLLRPHLQRLAELREGNGDPVGAEEALGRARRIAATSPRGSDAQA